MMKNPMAFGGSIKIFDIHSLPKAQKDTQKVGFGTLP